LDWLGQFHCILPAVIITFIAIGLPLLVVRRHRRDAGLPPVPSTLGHQPIPLRQASTHGPVARFAVTALILLLACRYLSSVHQTEFEPQDDIAGYLLFPVKMLQTGHYAPDPYSDRRMTGLGGQQWTQSLVIAPFDLTAINLFDHGIALLLLLLISWEWMRSIGISRSLATIILLVLALTYPNYVNTASFITMSALLSAIFVLLLDEFRTVNQAILLALLVSGICSLKTTVIPLVGMVLAIHFVATSISTRNIRPILTGFLVATVTFILLLPWMLAMHQSSNTYLAPLLGRGNSMLESMAGTMPASILRMLLCLCTACIACGLLIVLCLGHDAVHRRWMWTAAIFPLATAPVIFLITEMTGGLGWMRYAQPFIYGWIALPLTACGIAATSHHRWQRCLGQLAFVAVATVAIGQSFGWSRPKNLHGRTLQDLIAGPPKVIAEQCAAIANGIRWKSILPDEDVQRSRAMQSAVPAGAAILERIDFPYLFDFRRNTVFIDDHPGLVYPPPGLPERPTPAAMRDFLLSHGIRYIAYSYGDEAGFSHANAILANTPKAWDRSVIRHTFGVQDAFAGLMKNQRIVYDDRHTAVIDLSPNSK
jgi:hypothetical protein